MKDKKEMNIYLVKERIGYSGVYVIAEKLQHVVDKYPEADLIECKHRYVQIIYESPLLR